MPPVFCVIDDKSIPLYRIMWISNLPHFCGHDDCMHEGDYEVRLEQDESVWASRKERNGLLQTIEAWKNGCKGVTVYRDGSRDGVLIAGDNKKEKKKKPHKRPKVLEAEIQRIKNNNEDWIAFIGLTNNEPYEIFTGMVDEDVLFIPKNVTKGKIIKNKDENNKSRYDFQYINKFGYKTTVEGLSHKFNKEFWNYAKLISGVLRHGMPIIHVVNLVSSLQLNSDTINTWRNGVERALKKYIPDGTKASEEKKCDTCGANQLVYQEGCLICTSCGPSKCG